MNVYLSLGVLKKWPLLFLKYPVQGEHDATLYVRLSVLHLMILHALCLENSLPLLFYVAVWDGKTPSPLGEHFSI